MPKDCTKSSSRLNTESILELSGKTSDVSKPHLGHGGCISWECMTSAELTHARCRPRSGVGTGVGLHVGFWERRLRVHPRATVQHRQETCQTASAGGCLQHVQKGTRNCLMINHCQPLFSLKTGLLDKAGNEALFWVCCYVIVQELELVHSPCKIQLPLCPILMSLGENVVVRVPASGYRAANLQQEASFFLGIMGNA